MGIRPRSDQSVTSGWSLPVVQPGPEYPKVVHPCGSQPRCAAHGQWFSRASVVQGSAALLPAMSVLGASEPSKIIPCISRDPAGTPCDLGVIARMPVAQLDPSHGARLFKCDRSCWKSGLRAARLTNAYQRRPSAPPRKMTADPVQCGGQTVLVHMSAFSRHVSIMRLLPLGYEHYDARLARLRRSAASR